MILTIQHAAPAPALLDTTSVISVGLLITIIVAVAWLSRTLTRIEERQTQIFAAVEALSKVPDRLLRVEQKLEHVEKHVGLLEGDVSNLWAAARSGQLDVDDTRRERGPYGAKPQRPQS